MSIGPGVGSLLNSGSLSPQRAVRARVLREKETSNDNSSHHNSINSSSSINSTSDAAGTKTKPVTKVATKGWVPCAVLGGVASHWMSRILDC